MTRRNLVDATEHLPGLRRYARALTQSATAADDLVQQTLLRAIEGAASFRAGAPLRPWLFAILHNEFVSGQRRSLSEQRALAELAQREVAADRPSEEQSALLRETAAQFQKLPEAQRAVLHLIAIEELSYQQAADVLGVPIGTVMSRLSRARGALRDAAERTPANRAMRIVGGTDAS